MKREDVVHLATLARIELSESELANLPAELSSIVTYVAVIADIAADSNSAMPEVGPIHNVFRKDEVTNEAGEYTKALLAEMPHTEGQYLKVKKILSASE